MAYRIVQTMNAKDAGDITKALASIPENDTKTVAYLGVIIGMASGLSYRSNKYSDEPSVALTGIFEATPYDPNGETVQGASLFLAGAVQGMLVKAVRGDDVPPVTKAPKLGTAIDVPISVQLPIRVEIGIMRAGDDGKYKWVTNIVGDPTKIDVLEGLRSEVVKHGNERMKMIGSGRAPAMLAAPQASAGPAATNTPAKPTKGAKRK